MSGNSCPAFFFCHCIAMERISGRLCRFLRDVGDADRMDVRHATSGLEVLPEGIIRNVVHLAEHLKRHVVG